jgi:UDP-N-acetylmuramoyl-tripeptide--D-alanyl-D-alanine ligase
MMWTARDAALATGGQTTGAWVAQGVSIDTRSLAKGDMFIALKDIRDGHDFVAQALDLGAAAALVSRIPDGMGQDPRLLIVKDVLAGLQGLGQFARARSRAKVVGVTGSVGKTSTKEMLRNILGGQGRVHAAEASYNNHWGVPLTLARLPIDADFAVIEIGMNHPGEIAPLARMADLDIAVITTVGAAHLEAFENILGIAHEKADIFTGLRKGGMAIFHADLEVSAILRAKAESVGARLVSFGTAQDADYHLDQITLTKAATVVQASHLDQKILFKVASLGRHFATNGLACLAVADGLGLDRVIAVNDLGAWTPPSGRGGREVITLDVVDPISFELIDDAFNANPSSVAAALDLLLACTPQNGIGRVGTGRRIAILGDMLELGPSEIQLHQAITDHPDLKKIDVIHCVGPRMAQLWQVLPRSQRGEKVALAADLLPRLRSLVDAGDVVLVKSSKGTKCALIVDALRKFGQSSLHNKGEA